VIDNRGNENKNLGEMLKEIKGVLSNK
jgi:hypothetical protein